MCMHVYAYVCVRAVCRVPCAVCTYMEWQVITASCLHGCAVHDALVHRGVPGIACDYLGHPILRM